MPDTGESSSGDGARAMEDHDAQVARRMQDMLDEEASLEAVSKLRIKEERTSYSIIKEWKWNTNSVRAKAELEVMTMTTAMVMGALPEADA